MLWMFQVKRLLLTNQNDLFQSRVVVYLHQFLVSKMVCFEFAISRLLVQTKEDNRMSDRIFHGAAFWNILDSYLIPFLLKSFLHIKADPWSQKQRHLWFTVTVLYLLLSLSLDVSFNTILGIHSEAEIPTYLPTYLPMAFAAHRECNNFFQFYS